MMSTTKTSFCPGSRPVSAAPQALYRKEEDKDDDDDDQDQPDRPLSRLTDSPFMRSGAARPLPHLASGESRGRGLSLFSAEL